MTVPLNAKVKNPLQGLPPNTKVKNLLRGLL